MKLNIFSFKSHIPVSMNYLFIYFIQFSCIILSFIDSSRYLGNSHMRYGNNLWCELWTFFSQFVICLWFSWKPFGMEIFTFVFVSCFLLNLQDFEAQVFLGICVCFHCSYLNLWTIWNLFWRTVWGKDPKFLF